MRRRLRTWTLRMTGQPCAVTKSSASWAVVTAVSVPGMMGSPAAMADCRAATLSPIFAITAAWGPMNLRSREVMKGLRVVMRRGRSLRGGEGGGGGGSPPDARLDAGLGEVGPLGEEAVTRVDRVYVMLLGMGMGN